MDNTNPFQEGDQIPFQQQLNQMNPQQQMQIVNAMKQRGILPNQMNQVNLQLLQLQQQQQQQRLLYQLQQQKQAPGSNMTQQQQQQLRAQRMVTQQTMMQMVCFINKTGLHNSPQFQAPGTPQLPKTSPSLQQTIMPIPTNNLVFNARPNQRIQDPQKLLARNFALQQQIMNGNSAMNVNTRPPIPTPALDKKGASFPIAPTQATRCFFTQPLHGLIDSSTLFQSGFQNASNIVLGQKMEPNLFGNHQNEIQPILNSSGPDKRKLQVLLSDLDCVEEVDTTAEDVFLINESILQFADYFIDQVVYRACKIAKHRKSTILEPKDSWNIRIPGYQTNTKSIKNQVVNSHVTKVQQVQRLKREEMINRASQYQIKELMAQEMMSLAEMKETVELGIDEDVVVSNGEVVDVEMSGEVEGTEVSDEDGDGDANGLDEGDGLEDADADGLDDPNDLNDPNDPNEDSLQD